MLAELEIWNALHYLAPFVRYNTPTFTHTLTYTNWFQHVGFWEQMTRSDDLHVLYRVPQFYYFKRLSALLSLTQYLYKCIIMWVSASFCRLLEAMIMLVFKDFQSQSLGLSSHFVYFVSKALPLAFFYPLFNFYFVGSHQKHRRGCALLFIVKQEKCHICHLNTNMLHENWRALYHYPPHTHTQKKVE